jgi:DNA mismatch endonuclease (patch repair protein)
MSDVFSKAKRSDVMSRIRSRGNKTTELAFARMLRSHHVVGWRRHLSIRIAPSGLDLRNSRTRRPSRVRPDFVFRGCRVVVFVDGCFWHGCLIHGAKPKSNSSFWRDKLTTNAARDRFVTKSLRRHGWRVLRIWEHQLENEARILTKVKALIALNCPTNSFNKSPTDADGHRANWKS